MNDEGGHHWFTSDRMSEPPSRYLAQQPASSTAASIQESMCRFPTPSQLSMIDASVGSPGSSTPYRLDSRGGRLPPHTPHEQPSRTSSRTHRTNRRQRSPSLDQQDSRDRQGYGGELRNRDLHRQRRQTLASESENVCIFCFFPLANPYASDCAPELDTPRNQCILTQKDGRRANIQTSVTSPACHSSRNYWRDGPPRLCSK